jgi:hypothetical protein
MRGTLLQSPRRFKPPINGGKLVSIMASFEVKKVEMTPEMLDFWEAAGFVHLTIEKQAQYDELRQFFWHYLLTIGIENLPLPIPPSPDRFYLTYLLTADPSKVYRYELEILEQYRRFLESI